MNPNKSPCCNAEMHIESGLFVCPTCQLKYTSGAIWTAKNPILSKHRAPLRVWRTVAILSVILFLAVCAWAYMLITNL